jgi:AAA ATPase domain
MHPLAIDQIEEHTWVIGTTSVELLFHSQRFAARMTFISGIFENRYGIKHGKRAFQQITFYHCLRIRSKRMALSRNKPVVCPILIGRAAELTALHALVDQAKLGEGQVALISGEAGIGKSRLVAEVKTHAIAQGFRLFQGNCFPGDISSTCYDLILPVSPGLESPLS